MVKIHRVLLLSGLVMLLVTGASAVTFVINDGDASVSIGASSNHDVAFSVVAADNPDSYSASLSAGDAGGASASQESNVVGADRIFSATAGISSDGDYAYTFTETAVGSTKTTQQAQASQGNNASASQDTTSMAVAGAATSNGTEIDETSASQSVAFILGVNSVNLSGTTVNNASAYQNGIFAGIAGNTLGIARPKSGDFSFTRACIAAGGLTFDNTATTDSETTSVAQDVKLAGIFGSASAVAIDNQGPLASQSAIVGGGTLATDQAASTDAIAVASQTGTFAGLFGGTMGLALAPEGDISETNAGVFVGGMTFDDTAVAGETTTTASQEVVQAGLLGFSHTSSIDQNGNIAGEDASFVGGILGNDQSTDTLGSANAVQDGGFIGVGAITNGLAVATNGGSSHSTAGVFTGAMLFSDEQSAQDNSTSSGQAVHVAGLAGTASVESTDGLNSTREGAGIVLGSLDTIQEATTSRSAHASQAGAMSALYGKTWGDAASGAEQSWTQADVVIGSMTFDSAATADGNTEAGQIIGINGNVLPVAGAGRAAAGSDDGAGNVTEAGAGIILGNLGVVQQTDTVSSAHSTQLGGMNAGIGKTWGYAASGSEQSWTEAGVLIGSMTFGNAVTADGSTEAGQAVGMTALGGQTSAVSNDGAGNLTGAGADIILGNLGVTQQTGTIGSAQTTQFGSLGAGVGKTWGDAASGSGQSWTEAGVVAGTMEFGNTATADGHTTAGQFVGLSGLAGESSAGSDDGAGNVTSTGAGFLLGSLNVSQSTDTSSSANTVQFGNLAAALGTTWGDARSGSEHSWTNADVIVGTMSFDNKANAGSSTSASQTLGMAGLSGNASAGSDDGAGNITSTGTGFLLGSLNVSQSTDTSGSANTAQFGNLAAALGTTWGDAASGSEHSWTNADVIVGTMTFDNKANAGSSTFIGQAVYVPVGVAANASAGSDDGQGDVTGVGAGILGGSMNLIQASGTGTNAQTSQSGSLTAVHGTTGGNATSGDGDQSWTSADVDTGTIILTNNNVYASDAGTSAGQTVKIDGLLGLPALAGSASVGSDNGTNSATVGAAVTAGYLDMDQQQAGTGGSASASQTGTITAESGTMWGNASSETSESWTAADVTAGTINLANNSVYASGTGTSAGHTVQINGLLGIPAASGSASVGSSDGSNSATVGAQFTAGYLAMDQQQTGTGASALARQSGTVTQVLGGIASTWGNASSETSESWTAADVTTGTITLANNSVYASGIGTSAGQTVQINGFLGLPASAGSASVSSKKGMNTTQVGAGFTSGSLNMNQSTGTGGSAIASQYGTLTTGVLGTGRTWGNAASGAGQSWTSANTIGGSITMTENKMTAGPSTAGMQNLNLSSLGGGSAWALSKNTVDGNYANVSAGILSSGNLDVVQNTASDAMVIGCATANQPYARLTSWNTATGSIWTLSEAGNNSNVRRAYVLTQANSAMSGWPLYIPYGVTLTSSSRATGGLTNSTTFETKTRSGIIGGGGAGTTKAYTKNTTDAISTSSGSANTKAMAWASTTGIGRTITTF